MMMMVVMRRRNIRITLMMMRMGEGRRAADCDNEDRERW